MWRDRLGAGRLRPIVRHRYDEVLKYNKLARVKYSLPVPGTISRIVGWITGGLTTIMEGY